jgi:predicted DNA-binding transcriptional regulator YafY
VKLDINELGLTGRLPLRKDGQYWVLAEHAHLPQLQVHLNLAEATSLYIAGRLLSQIHDGQNRHVILALTKLLDALPQPLQEHQRLLIEMAQQREQSQSDRSSIFETLAIGWATHRRVSLLYEPPRKQKFECLFSPYLLEPSGIGRTIYAIGERIPPGALRTYKLERIRYACLTEEPFEISEEFDGPKLLKRAWTVMYGAEEEELVEVRLRFSHYVTRCVKETLWHPEQHIVDTPEGCEWSVSIGDTLEIENWIRGWGPDCEVLSPPELRERIIADLRRSALMYQITPVQPSDDEDDLLSDFFEEERWPLSNNHCDRFK